VLSIFAPFSIKRVEAVSLAKTITGSTIENPPSTIAAKAQETRSRWRESEILVHFRERAPISKMNALLRANGAQWKGRLRGQSGIERLRLSRGADLEAVAARLRSSVFIEFAEPNYLITADQTSAQPPVNNPPEVVLLRGILCNINTSL